MSDVTPPPPPGRPPSPEPSGPWPASSGPVPAGPPGPWPASSPGAPPPPPPSMMPPPPGYWSPGAAYQPSSTKRIGGLATAIVAVQAVVIVLSIAVVAVQGGLTGSARDFLDDTITRADFEDDLVAFLGITLISSLASLALIVLLIVWSWRVSGNLVALGRQPVTWKSGLTIVVWLLGGCTLQIITFLMLREHWRGSDPEVAPGDPSWRQRPVTPLVVAWFVVTLAQLLVGVSSGITGFGGVNVGNSTRDVAESLVDRFGLVLAAGALQVVTGVLLVMIVRQLTARQRQLTGE